jgi:glutamate racemase
MSDTRPIGVLDSGLGGLTVAHEILRLMPGERIVYLGDTARYPYGNRSDEVIRAFTLECARELCKHNIKLLVVACNTMAAVAMKIIEQHLHDVPVIGVILPGVRAAVLRTADRKIGVIGTHATIRSSVYKQSIQRIDASIKVYETSSPLLLPLVEERMFDHDIARMAAQFYLYEMMDGGVDCLILGCSLFPPLFEVVQGTVGTRMQVLDSALWTAKEAQDILTALDLKSGSRDGGVERSAFLFTEKPEGSHRLMELFYGAPLTEYSIVAINRGTV